MSNLKKLIFAVVILGLISVLFFVNYNSVPSSKIVGTIKKVDEKSMIVFGRYDTPEKKPLEEISLVIPQDIKITRTSFVIPPAAMYSKEPFYVDKLPKETKEVDLQTLINDKRNVNIGVEVLLKKSLFSKSAVAKEVMYTSPRY